MAEDKKKILTIDDDDAIRRSIAAYLEDSGFLVVQANNGRKGMEVFAAEKPDLVLLDLRMPEMDGVEVLGELLKVSPDTPVIVVSGLGTMKDVIETLRMGAWDYITKPVLDMAFLEHVVNKCLERAELINEHKLYQEHLEKAVVERTIELEDRSNQLQHASKSLRLALEGTVDVVSKAVEARDPYTAGHQRRVARLAVAIGKKLGMQADQLEGLMLGAQIHDIGKISTPAEILTKPARLTQTEYALVQNHVEVGYQIMKDIDFPWPISDIVYQHHERVDGSGYPRGLKGEEISLSARIVAVADVVEAMSSHRPYRPGLGLEKALAEIRENSGKLYDPQVVDICTALFDRGEFEFEQN